MPLTERVDLSIALTVSDTCDTISLADTTPDYGGSGKIAKSDVVTNTIVVNMAGGIYFTYVLTISGGMFISAATLSLNGATPVATTGIVTSAWPFITDVNEFDLFGSYGVTLPEFVDGTYEVDYSVSGTSGETHFNYTTSEALLVTCVSSECCVEEMAQKVDVNCECSDESIWNFLRADTYLTLAKFAASKGNLTRAQMLLDKANDLCNCECSC